MADGRNSIVVTPRGPCAVTPLLFGEIMKKRSADRDFSRKILFFLDCTDLPPNIQLSTVSGNLPVVSDLETFERDFIDLGGAQRNILV